MTKLDYWRLAFGLCIIAGLLCLAISNRLTSKMIRNLNQRIEKLEQPRGGSQE